MFLDKIRSILPHNKKDYPLDFQKIIQNLYSSSEPDDENVLFIWNAYCFSQDAHAGQKRHSGKPYFTHCASVGVTLSEWKMDFKTPSSVFMDPEYSEEFDMLLYQKIGYDKLSDLIMGLFITPYAATSLREYYATGFTEFYLDSNHNFFRKVSPELYKKLLLIQDPEKLDNIA